MKKINYWIITWWQDGQIVWSKKTTEKPENVSEQLPMDMFEWTPVKVQVTGPIEVVEPQESFKNDLSKEVVHHKDY